MSLRLKIKKIKGSAQHHFFCVGKKSGAGFTLIELLVVLAIIGLLSTMAMVAFRFARESAKVAKAQADVSEIVNAIKLLENDTGYWPGHQPVDTMCRDLPGGCPGGNELCGDGCTHDLSSGPAGLTQDDASDPYDKWNGPYMARIPLDPWGNQYFFDTDYDDPVHGWSVVIGSYGPNGVGNNVYDGDDILKIIY